MDVSQGSGVCAGLCIRRTLCRHVIWRLVHQLSFFAVWLSFDCFWRMVHCTNRQKHSKPLVYKSSQVYQDCSNSVPIVKNSQNSTKMTTKMSTKTVPTVYQQCTKNSQKTLRTAKMTIGVSTVTVLPRLYQQCNNSLPIVNKNLAIAHTIRRKHSSA